MGYNPPMSEKNDKVITFHFSGSRERIISFPTVGDTDPESPYRMLTETENTAFESICELLVSAISHLPAEENSLEVVIPTNLGTLSNAMVTHIFNWLKLNHLRPVLCDDYFRKLSAVRI